MIVEGTSALTQHHTKMNTKPIARKATHKGTCQVCGCLQKLPSARLSTHGYTVRWGFFSGTCHGTNALPFETDCSLIAASVAQAKGQLEATRAAIESLIAGHDADADGLAWFRTYVEARYAYVWEWSHVFATVVTTADGFQYTTFARSTKFVPRSKFEITADGHRKLQSVGFGSTIATVVADANANYVSQVLAPRVAQLEEYIRWQTQRLSEWTPHPEALIAL